MKRLNTLAILTLLTFFCSCKKFIQQQEENAVLNLMTNGYWYVSGYRQNDSNITASFSGYLFKFEKNNTVTGTRNNVSVNGQWSADVASRTINANFPNATDPIIWLNQTWTIKDSYTDSVSARSFDSVTRTLNILQLKKQ